MIVGIHGEMNINLTRHKTMTKDEWHTNYYGVRSEAYKDMANEFIENTNTPENFSVWFTPIATENFQETDTQVFSWSLYAKEIEMFADELDDATPIIPNINVVSTVALLEELYSRLKGWLTNG